MELYALIKGMSYQKAKQSAKSKLDEVGLNESESDRLVSTYSGGMKRKLSVACATIGQPQIVFLDEPSTGMDPVARRHMWKVISKMVSKVDKYGNPKTSVILTTHSMEECEALCSRIGIMAGGKLRCLGSGQRLKSRFGQGFQVDLKLAEVERDDDDYQAIVQHFKSCVDTALILADYVDVDKSTGWVNGLMKLDEVKTAVETLTNDQSISVRISPENPYGYLIYKNASFGPGVTFEELAAFCANELRIKTLVDFFEVTYPNKFFLRERQDRSVRIELGSEKLKFSSLFATVEENKTILRLEYFGISQTSLEQVFNIHAKEDEKAKDRVED